MNISVISKNGKLAKLVELEANMESLHTLNDIYLTSMVINVVDAVGTK